MTAARDTATIPSAASGLPLPERVAVLDIGSNSVRMVVYDPPARAPIPIFNEKVLCGLGRDLGRTGRLDPTARRRALDALGRFARIAGAMAVERIEAVATAAIREAEDGRAFVEEVAKTCAIDVRIIDGIEEARLSALGVLAGVPAAAGLMGDLGGGSLELVELAENQSGRRATLPLGPLRLPPQDTAGDDAWPEIDIEFGRVPWLAEQAGGDLFLVGGAWRGLGRIDMRRQAYPLRVLHGYTVPSGRIQALAAAVAGLGPASLRRIEDVSLERSAQLPPAARVLMRLIAIARPKRVIFSAYGLREGLLFDRLTAAERGQDPLIEICRRVAADARFPDQAAALLDWTAALFQGETPAERRLREAASLLSDIGWRTHSDYRAEQAFLDVVRGPYVGLDHNERARLALMVRARYTGRVDDAQVAAVDALIDPEEALQARRVGQALRLALTISGGAPSLLAQTRLRRVGNSLHLEVAPTEAPLAGLVVRKRLEALAETMDCAAEVAVGEIQSR